MNELYRNYEDPRPHYRVFRPTIPASARERWCWYLDVRPRDDGKFKVTSGVSRTFAGACRGARRHARDLCEPVAVIELPSNARRKLLR